MMELKVTIEKLVNKAEGLARYDGKVLFVYGSLADEVVTIKISKKKRCHVLSVIASITPIVLA
jgi:tRNA/tmRNA/rRNA uracil-C5-methylase (TrmA/RlmC/RlmD family)